MSVIKNQYIQLTVLKVETEINNHWSVYFSRPANFVFDTGDWIDIEFKNRTLKGGFTYSISSSPTESDLRITFRDGISEFKQALQSLLPGDKTYITQYGNSYKFQLNKNQSSLLIAGGVGIAPFRSMIKEMYDHTDTNTVTLIYLNQTKDFLFKDELDMWSAKLPNVEIVYICTKDINRKKREKCIQSLIKNINQNFYISGPPGMVDSNEHLLIDMGVRIQDIRIDSFGGY
jgi:ferredoxin-NADP reductase